MTSWSWANWAVLAACCALSACGRSDDVARPSGGRAVDLDAHASAIPASDPVPAPSASTMPISKDARAAYAKHLSAGRALAKDGRFGEASEELSRALSILPHDARALTDLGWTAFQSGDLARSFRASAEASRVATDPETKARALYNLGRAREARGERPEAEDLYRESLSLRSNDTVAARLVDLDAGTRARPKETELPCQKTASLEDLCSCLVAEVSDATLSPEELAARTCEITAPPKLPLARARVLHLATSSMESTYYLALSVPGGFRVAADLAHVYQPGMFGIEEELSIEDSTEQLLGGVKTLRVVVRHDRRDSDTGIDEGETASWSTMTICVLDGDKHHGVACPVQAPLRSEYKRMRLGTMPDDEIDEATRALMTPGLPIVRSSGFEVSIDKDGTATVVLVSGKASPEERAALGPHKLF
jgi:hypothetical protein